MGIEWMRRHLEPKGINVHTLSFKVIGYRQMSRNVKWAGVELAIFLMTQIQQIYTSLYSSWSNI